MRMVTVETFTDSAEEAERVYEPTLRPVEFAVSVCVPIALFFATVKALDENVSAAPFAAPVEAV
jgi:hypothetical protein